MKGFVAVGNDQRSNQVVRVAVWQSFDVQIHLRLCLRKYWQAMDVNSVLPDGQCLEREVARLGRILRALWCSSRPERVGELRDGKNALAPMTFALLRAHAGQQAEVV